MFPWKWLVFPWKRAREAFPGTPGAPKLRSPTRLVAVRRAIRCLHQTSSRIRQVIRRHRYVITASLSRHCHSSRHRHVIVIRRVTVSDVVERLRETARDIVERLREETVRGGSRASGLVAWERSDRTPTERRRRVDGGWSGKHWRDASPLRRALPTPPEAEPHPCAVVGSIAPLGRVAPLAHGPHRRAEPLGQADPNRQRFSCCERRTL